MSRADGKVKRKQEGSGVTWEKVTKKRSGKEVVENAGGHLWLDLKRMGSFQMEYGPSRSEGKFLQLCGAIMRQLGHGVRWLHSNPSTATVPPREVN